MNERLRKVLDEKMRKTKREKKDIRKEKIKRNEGDGDIRIK